MYQVGIKETYEFSNMLENCCRLGPNWNLRGTAEYQINIAESYEFSANVKQLCRLDSKRYIGGEAEYKVSIAESCEFSYMSENCVATVRTGI